MKKSKKVSISVIAIVGLMLSIIGTSGFVSNAADNSNRVDVLIGFTQIPGPNENALVKGRGGAVKHSYHLVPAIAANIPEAAIAGLLKNPRITHIDLDGKVYAFDAELDNAWGVKRIGSGAVHADNNKGAGVNVAVIDSGIDYNHSDLSANYRGGYDFVNEDADPMDDDGHGTHVAGTIGARDDDSGVVGVAPKASIYALKVLNASGGGSWSDIIAALQWAKDNGIQITNNSYGSGQNPGGIVQAAFDNSAAAGILHIAAAGNSGNPKGKGNNVGWPARYDSVIAVAATDDNDDRASFSSTGSQVELTAPGTVINSTKLGGGYVEFNGTSMASPHVAGSAALVIAAGIADNNGNGFINDEVREVLNSTADDLGDSGRDPLYGFGLINVAAAVAAVGPVPPSNDAPVVSITNPSDGLIFDSGIAISFNGTASDTEDGDLTANVVWISDLDGQIGAGGSFSTILSDGVHIVTASATDSGEKTGSASISITVGSPPAEATTVTVSSIVYTTEGGRNQDKHLLITITLVDDFGASISGASVSIDLSRDGGVVGSGSGTTGASGTLTFSLKNIKSGSYQTTITNVSAEGLIWDGNTPENGYEK